MLVIASALSAIVMFIYSILLLIMNRGVLPHAIRLGGFRLAVTPSSGRIFLHPRGHRIRRAAVLAMARAVRLRVLPALTIWLALIALVKLVEAL